MGAWGVRALDSDEGLDVFDEFTDYCIENDEIKMGDLLEHFKETGFLPEKPEEIDFLYDHTVMVLAELLEEYHKNGKVIINISNPFTLKIIILKIVIIMNSMLIIMFIY